MRVTGKVGGDSAQNASALHGWSLFPKMSCKTRRPLTTSHPTITPGQVDHSGELARSKLELERGRQRSFEKSFDTKKLLGGDHFLSHRTKQNSISIHRFSLISTSRRGYDVTGLLQVPID
jgi:hypothetical protein